MKVLPEMTVEARNSETAHNVPAPDLSKENMSEQIQDAIQLNEDAKLYEVRELLIDQVNTNLAPLAWKDTTLTILQKHISKVIPVEKHEIPFIAKSVLNVNGFDELARWVQDDMCAEVFNRMLKYCLSETQKHKQEKDFIDGSGYGYLNKFTKNLKKNIEKTFDTKYYYKVPRPLQYIKDNYDGMDLAKVANKIHPGHWSYSQGHSTKSLTSVQTLNEVFHLDKNCYKSLLIAALLFGHGRDGNLIHYPMDTAASGYNTELDEFNQK